MADVKVFEQDINGNSFSAKAEAELQPQVFTLFEIIEEIPASKIKDGFIIEAGFLLFTLSGKDNVYRIQSPDFTNDPFSSLTDDLSIALFVQLEQMHLLRQYNIVGESTRFDEKILIVKGALSEQKIILQRSGDCSKGDSGWNIRSAEDTEEHDDPSDYEAVHAYQLLKLRQPIIKILSLPYEYLVVFDGNDIEAIINENDENLLE